MSNIFSLLLTIFFIFALFYLLKSCFTSHGIRLFGGATVSKEDLTFVRNNTFNDTTKEKFFELINKYPYQHSTHPFYIAIIEHNSYDQNSNHSLYLHIINTNPYTPAIINLYRSMMIHAEISDEKNQYQTKHQSKLCELFVEKYPFISKSSEQTNIKLYDMICTEFSRFKYDYSRDIHLKIIETNPYGPDTHELYEMLLMCSQFNYGAKSSENYNELCKLMFDKNARTQDNQKLYETVDEYMPTNEE